MRVDGEGGHEVGVGWWEATGFQLVYIISYLMILK